MPPITLLNGALKSRKERRKEERMSKKKSNQHRENNSNERNNKESEKLPPAPTLPIKGIPKRKTQTKKSTEISKVDQKSIDIKKKRLSEQRSNDPYYGLDPNVAAALRRDDEEIAMLESKLLLKSSSSKSKSSKDQLQREYAKQEGYGNDFIDFLDDLDALVRNVVVDRDDDDDDDRNNTRKRKYKTLTNDEADDDMDDEFSDASSERDSTSSDFNNTSSDEDADSNASASDVDDSDEDGSEEIVPMKEPAIDDDSVNEYSDDEKDAEHIETDDNLLTSTERNHDERQGSDNESDEMESDDEQDYTNRNDDDADDDDEPDHAITDVYQPSKGEDIYGNIIDTTLDGMIQPKKYIPPHLRKNLNGSTSGSNTDSSRNLMTRADEPDVNSEARGEMLRELQRLLNSALNRLSETSIISIVQTISQMYSDKSYPTADINAVLWDHIQNACIINQATIMSNLIPIYVSTFVGIHIHKGGTIQLVEYLLENVVTKFWNELQAVHNSSAAQASIANEDGQKGDNGNDSNDGVPTMSSGSKQLSNLVLVICYMYNFGVVHCTLLYDIIRHLIEYCREIDVELLLLVLNHCGRTLRSDDSNALKEIMVMVQQKQSSPGTMNTSRAQYMVDTLMELKKTKRRKQDQPFAEQTLKLRKVLGHIKSNTTSKGRTGTTSSDSSLRITLRDILDVNTKGRWWKVGASWAGGSNPSQLLHGTNDTNTKTDNADGHKIGSTVGASKQNTLLLQLAAKYRMNTDTRRTIFCIIMGGTDYEDCFEKLVRAGMIKNRSERDTVRVLIECCCNEKTFNPYYAHLAARICDYQPQCKFTFQLAFWDTFKQLDDYTPRKVANLAKLLFHLVTIHQCLKLNVIKAIDIAAPEQLSESALIFVTIFLSSILEHFDNPQDTVRLFQKGTSNKKGSSSGYDDDDNDKTIYQGDNGIQASVTIFLVQVLKASPKYQKGSKFRTNLKAAIKACDTDNFF